MNKQQVSFASPCDILPHQRADNTRKQLFDLLLEGPKTRNQLAEAMKVSANTVDRFVRDHLHFGAIEVLMLLKGEARRPCQVLGVVPGKTFVSIEATIEREKRRKGVEKRKRKERPVLNLRPDEPPYTGELEAAWFGRPVGFMFA